MRLEQLGQGTNLAACVQSELGCPSLEWPSLAGDHQQFVLHAPAQ